MRIAFFLGHNADTFLRDILDHLRLRHDVRVIGGYGQSQWAGPEETAEALAWAELAWVEWAAEHLPALSRMPRGCPMVVRLHSFEAFTAYLAQTAWENVDLLMVVAEHIRAELVARVPDVTRRTRVEILPNGLDLSRFPLKRSFEPTYRCAFVASLRHTKCPPLLLQCFAAMAKAEPRLTLHLAGELFGNELERGELDTYLRHMTQILGLENRVFFHGRVADVNGFLEDKDTLLSTSLRESFGYNIAEAMAKGIRPLIHHFPAAEQVFPREWLFATVDECAALSRKPANPAAQRDFVEQRYSLERHLAHLAELLAPLAPGILEPQAQIRKPGFPGTAAYWQARYHAGRTSGAGSYGRLAAFKADTLNAFVAEHGIRSVVELGCGDGSQLALAEYPDYTGLDIAPAAVEQCRQRFADDPSKRFLAYDPQAFRPDSGPRAELALSLDVIYHLVEDALFEAYMDHLFGMATRFVAIYSSDRDEPGAPHVRHWKFTTWIERNRPEWKLLTAVPNPYPYDPAEPDDTSHSAFYFFTRK
ncbi:MAG: glycosyltransferase [Desulfocurvibacter africanus]